MLQPYCKVEYSKIHMQIHDMRQSIRIQSNMIITHILGNPFSNGVILYNIIPAGGMTESSPCDETPLLIRVSPVKITTVECPGMRCQYNSPLLQYFQGFQTDQRFMRVSVLFLNINNHYVKSDMYDNIKVFLQYVK